MMWLKVIIFHYVLNTILKSSACEEVSESELFLTVFDAIVMIELAVKIDSDVVETSILSCVTF